MTYFEDEETKHIFGLPELSIVVTGVDVDLNDPDTIKTWPISLLWNEWTGMMPL